MASFKSLSNTSDENATETLYALLKGLRAKVTRVTIGELLEQHPEFPSLLSLSDVLTDWQIDNTALQLNSTEQLRELPFPFIAHLNKNKGWYVLITALQGNKIKYTDSADGQKTEALADFERKWSGVVLLAETNEQSGEVDYATKHKQEFLAGLRYPFVLMGTLLIFLFVILSVAKNLTSPDWILLVTKSVGLAVSVLLVTKQLGSKDAFIERFCQINSKTNCDNVLNSPGAKLWGWLSWADVGLLYYAGSFLLVLLVGILPNHSDIPVDTVSIRPVMYWLALLVLPYTIFSVYYQSRVLQQWCSLCLAIQGVLLIEGTLAIAYNSPLPSFTQPYLLILSVFLLPTLTWVIVKPLLIALPQSRWQHKELMWLKRDPDLFRALLMQQTRMPSIPADLQPIILGNPKAEHVITMVTNPYCGSCAKAHATLEQLLRSNDNVKAVIIFAGDGVDGAATQVAMYLMALYKQGGNATKASKDWYEQHEKNFETWVKNYPINLDSTNWTSVANRHRSWCQKANITVTPTLFVDGYQLPKGYRIDSLRWLINYLPKQTLTMDLAKSK